MSNLFNSFREIKEKSLGVWFITVNTANITVFCPWRASFCCFSLSLAPNKERCIMRVPKNEIKLQQCLSPPCSVELLCPLCSTKVYSPFHDKQSSQFYNLTLSLLWRKRSRKWAYGLPPCLLKVPGNFKEWFDLSINSNYVSSDVQ